MPTHARSLALGLALGAGLTALLAMAPQDSSSPQSAPDDDQWAGRYRVVAVVPGDPDGARIVRIDTQTGEVAAVVWEGRKDGRFVVRP